MDRSNILDFILLSEYILDDAAAVFWFRKYDHCTYRQGNYIYQVINLGCQENPHAHASQDVSGCDEIPPALTPKCRIPVSGDRWAKITWGWRAVRRNAENRAADTGGKCSCWRKTTCFQIQFLQKAQLKGQMQRQSQTSPWLQKITHSNHSSY